MAEYQFNKGEVIGVQGTSTEFECVETKTVEGLPHYTFVPKHLMDEKRGGPANEQQPQEGESNE